MSSGEWVRFGVGGIVPVTWDYSKADDPGALTGYASVFNVIDQQDDIVLPGAFKRTLQHWHTSGRAIPLTIDHDRTVDGIVGSLRNAQEDTHGLRFTAAFSSTPRAQDARTKAREGHLNGLSAYGPIFKKSFETRDGREIRILHELGLHEVTLTPVPANTDALVTMAKSAMTVHHTRVVGGAWDANANVARISNDAGAATLRAMYALVRSGADPNLKGSYALPHHEVGTDGRPGAANVAGVRNALSRLPQTQGIDEATRSGAEAHLRAHLDDFNQAESSLRLPEAWTKDLVAALSLSNPVAQKAAVDLLIREQYGSGDGGSIEEEEEPPRQQQADSDAARYALELIGESGPGSNPPGGDPTSSLAESIVTTLDDADVTSDLDLLDRQIKEALGEQ